MGCLFRSVLEDPARDGALVLTVLTFLWHDPQYRHNALYTYDADYVNRMRSMLSRHLSQSHELVCCTDMPDGIDPRIGIVPLPPEVKAIGGCSPKLWAFHPGARITFNRRVLMLDLDAVILRQIDPLLDRDEAFIAWSVRDGAPGRFNTSMMLFDPEPFSSVWTSYEKGTSEALMIEAGLVGEEQDWVSLVVGEKGARWPRSGAGIESCQPAAGWIPPESARIVFFPGRRSPGMGSMQSTHPWIRAHWH